MSVFLIDFRFSLLVSGFVSFHLVCFDFSTTLTLRQSTHLSLYATLSHSLSLAFLSHASVSLSTVKKSFYLALSSTKSTRLSNNATALE